MRAKHISAKAYKLPMPLKAAHSAARIQTSRSSSVVKITGMAFWMDVLDDGVGSRREEAIQVA
jgi:hypothetical protein